MYLVRGQLRRLLECRKLLQSRLHALSGCCMAILAGNCCKSWQKIATHFASCGRVAKQAIGVTIAMPMLAIAMVLVRVARLLRWRASLGQIRDSTCLVSPPLASSEAPLTGGTTARRLAGCVERAVRLAPFRIKCLPQAVATQWMLRLARLPSSLIIAIHVKDRSGDHAYHAWVEHRGDIIIGQCDRDLYRSMMVFDQPASRQARG